MKLVLTLSIIGALLLTSCNTVMGTAKGVGRDAKAVYIYSRDAVSGKPVSDK
tara:strand:+ start:415 stop:570 length:156 start_codon:yes stop_codon:yes gene_type:complete